MEFIIREMTIDDHAEVYRLWQETDGVTVSGADTPAGVQQYLERNPGSSFVAVSDNRIVGAVLGGHDGRRGYIHHLGVADTHRSMGVGSELVKHAVSAIQKQQIQKCHIFVVSGNRDGIRFWEDIGWQYREDLAMMSKSIDG